MRESKKSFNVIALGCALAGAALVVSCGGGDPVETAVAVYIKASNTGGDDQFGGSVALSGDGNTLAIGAPFEDSGLLGVTAGVVNEVTAGNAIANSGVVYVLIRSGTAWGQQAYVKPLNTGTTGAGDNFGSSVALSSDGNTLAVGAPLEDSSTAGINSTPNESAADAGAVYVFNRVAGVWTQQAYVKPSNTGTTGAGDNFGFSVALSADGNTLAVGAPLEDSGTTGINTVPNEAATDAGAVYVFTRDGAGAWSEQAYVKASNTGVTGALDNFGVSVSLSGDGNTLAVGASGEASGTTGIDSTPDESAPGAGAAYVFARIGVTWSQQAYVKASNTGPGDDFGSSVALSGDGSTLAVGAPREDSGTTGIGSTPNESAANAGAVYVYSRTGTVWAQQAYVKASNTGSDDRFGTSVALSGDGNALMVGAINEDGSATGIGGTSNELAVDAGAVYAYTRSGTVWTQQSYVKASNTGAGDGFGVSVALSSNGSTRAIGAQFEDGGATGVGGNQGDNTAPNAGAVYVYQ